MSYHQNPQRIFGQPLARCLGGVFFLLSFALTQQAQAQAISLQAGRMKSLKKGDKTVQWLRENVRFEQSGSMVFCDEAEYDPQTEDLVGRGNVRITNPDGATVTGKTLS